ncbi:hypothetical protein DFH08DRAFT_814245 [Mycena albidolilacea]|uniref:Uncharacterized protein n=1 Tax=Mycena albidolilacea TaxID=1033008 RepID=A0AAD6ZQF4_9AGAR|nr:hypothetical protein DFH08DRAFT_814245 [Mycena albidolilacea]
MTTDLNRHHTHAATRAGIYAALKLPRETPSPTSSALEPPSPTRSDAGATGSPKTRPVTPKLLYSVVASAVSLSRGVSPAAPEGQGDVPGSASISALSELPSLTWDVDFGPVTAPMSAATHRNNPLAVPPETNIIDAHFDELLPSLADSRSPLTVTWAMQEMNQDNLIVLAGCYKAMACKAMAEANYKISTKCSFDSRTSLQGQDTTPAFVSLSPPIPEVEGPSRNKGKGPDPCNWGAVDSLVDFSDHELEAQREAFQNFAEINCVVKQEEHTESMLRPQVPNVVLKPTARGLERRLPAELPPELSWTKRFVVLPG